MVSSDFWDLNIVLHLSISFVALQWLQWLPRRSVQMVNPQYRIRQDKDIFGIDAIMSKPGKKSEIYGTMEINGQSVEIKILTLALNVM